MGLGEDITIWTTDGMNIRLPFTALGQIAAAATPRNKSRNSKPLNVHFELVPNTGMARKLKKEKFVGRITDRQPGLYLIQDVETGLSHEFTLDDIRLDTLNFKE